MTTNSGTGERGGLPRGAFLSGTGLSRLRRGLRAHPYAVDVLIAAGAFVCILLAAATEPHGPAGHPRFGERELSTQTVLLAVLACGALVLRRLVPMQVLCVTGLISVVALAAAPHTGAASDGRTPLVVAAVLALYTVSNRTDRLTSWRVGAVTVAVLTASAMLFGSSPWYAQENIGIFAWTGLAAAAGEAVRSRRAFIDAMRERAERAERTREEEARRRVAEERMRIARELHDVVAHHIALVNVQAGVASHVMDQRPDQARQALAYVREASRNALDELQTTVGLLRQSDDSAAPTEPAPGLEVLDELVAGFRHTGMDIRVDAPSAPVASLPSAIDLTAYRVVQEALTNVQKHVGTGAHAQVRIDRGPDALEVAVTDDGAGDTEQAEDTGGGHGLLGMRERAAALDGECETGPLPGGGFGVRVRLPLQHAARQRPPEDPDGQPEQQPDGQAAGHGDRGRPGARKGDHA